MYGSLVCCFKVTILGGEEGADYLKCIFLVYGSLLCFLQIMILGDGEGADHLKGRGQNRR